jgi:hypothetical protein
MSENEEISPENEMKFFVEHVDNLAQRGETDLLLANIGIAIMRMAQAQEKLVALAAIDIEAQVEAEVERRAEEKAQQLDSERTKRNFIGKR